MNLFHHSVQFYDDDRVLADSVSSFAAAGLQAGARVILIMTAGHRADLSLHGVPNSRTGAAPIYMDAAETLSRFMLGDRPSDARFFRLFEALIDAPANRQPVWIFGEMVGLLCGEGRCEAALRLEDLWNRLATRRAFTLLCAYPLRRFVMGNHTDSFLQVCRTHNHVLSPQAVGG
jgi:hypothetical protein